MRRLLPDPAELELDALYAGLTLPAGCATAEGGRRPWVALGMVSSVDGGAALDGRTADLGAAADRVAFRRLRAACDAIVVGAGTVRAEGYGPARGDEARRRDRVGRGLAPEPRLVVVTRRLALDPGDRVFSGDGPRPVIATTSDADDAAAARLAEVADVVRVGEGTVALDGLLQHLADLGLWRVLCEGGPSLNAALLAAGLVDEVFLTVSPVILGGDAPRIAEGRHGQHPVGLTLDSVHEHEGELLLRYRRVDAPTALWEVRSD